jgi:hypothetical protein
LNRRYPAAAVKGATLIVLIVIAEAVAVAMRDKNCHFNTQLIGRVYCTDR